MSRSNERERSREDSRNSGGHHQHRDRDEGTRSHESLDVYWKAVRDDQQNFDAWTKLITAAEQFVCVFPVGIVYSCYCIHI